MHAWFNHGKRWVLLLTVVTALLTVVSAQTAQPGDSAAGKVIRNKPTDAALWLTFVPFPKGAPVRSIAGQGTLDLGSVSYLTGSTQEGVQVKRGKQTFTVSTRFGLQVGAPNSQGTAKLLGVLSQANPAIRVAIDGIDLSVAPQVIQMAVRFGVVTEHQLDIEIPVSMPEAAAQVANSISFLVIAD
jgi:hypothetical protein